MKMFGIEFNAQTLHALNTGADAYRRKDWDALAAIVLPFFPPLPDDGSGHTETPTRAAFRALIPEMKMPAPLVRASERYLEQASNGQLRMIARNLHAIARGVPTSDTTADDPRPPLLLEK